MPGYQEVLIISAIVLGVIFLPRMMSRPKPPPRMILHRRGPSGKWRAAVALSMLYPLVCGAVMQPWETAWEPFLAIAIGPVVTLWLLYWVWLGFRGR